MILQVVFLIVSVLAAETDCCDLESEDGQSPLACLIIFHSIL